MFGAPSALAAPPASFGGIDSASISAARSAPRGPYASSGFVGGGHVGYNFQSGGFVGGVEADLLLSNISGNVSAASSITIGTLDSLRARAGYAFGRLLVYGTLGGAYSNMSYTNAGGSFNTSLGGYAFGLGGEYAMLPNISLRGELRRYIMGDAFYNLPAGPRRCPAGQTLFWLGVAGIFEAKAGDGATCAPREPRVVACAHDRGRSLEFEWESL